MPSNQNRTRLITPLLLAFVLIGSVIAYNLFFKHAEPIGPTQKTENDPLCSYVSGSLQLRCVVGLASESVLGPGHFVAYPANSAATTRVSFPDGDLLSSSCLVPGERADTLLAMLKQQETQNTISLSTITYHLDRSFQAGADIPIPRLNNLTFKAGPKLTEVMDIAMSTDTAWLKFIDVNVLLDIIQNAGIRTRCLENLRAGQYSVISKALVAKGINVVVRDKTGRTIGLSAAAKSGQVLVSAGANATSDVDKTITTATSMPAVLGVTFFDQSIFTQRPALAQPVVYLPSGHVTLTVTGNGGQGVISAQTRTATIGETANVATEGGESSECKDDFERTKSMASLSANVTAPESQTISFFLNGAIRGGHYATVSACALGNPVGKTGHDNGTTAVATFTGASRIIVRDETATQLELQTNGMPDAQIEVRDPRDELLPINSGRYALRGAGVYFARATWTVRSSINGAELKNISQQATMRVLVR